MTSVLVNRIFCDNIECELYVDELIRENPESVRLEEYVTRLKDGWTCLEENHYCPAHGLRPS
jgi:hypothetical protein